MKLEKDPVWCDYALAGINKRIKKEWLGLVLRYSCRRLPAAQAYMITESTTVDDFVDAVNREWSASGDAHHCFIESFEPDGIWLDIWTGS